MSTYLELVHERFTPDEAWMVFALEQALHAGAEAIQFDFGNERVVLTCRGAANAELHRSVSFPCARHAAFDVVEHEVREMRKTLEEAAP